jgi:hypothetical protein
MHSHRCVFQQHTLAMQNWTAHVFTRDFVGERERPKAGVISSLCRAASEPLNKGSSSFRSFLETSIFQIILGNLNLSDHSRKPQSFRSFYIAPDTRLCVVPPNTTKPYTQRCGRSRNSPDTFHQREKEHLPNFCWQRHPIDTEYEAAP